MIIYTTDAVPTAYNSASGWSGTSSTYPCCRAPLYRTSCNAVSCYATKHATTNAHAVQHKQYAMQPCNVATGAACYHANGAGTFPAS